MTGKVALFGLVGTWSVVTYSDGWRMGVMLWVGRLKRPLYSNRARLGAERCAVITTDYRPARQV